MSEHPTLPFEPRKLVRGTDPDTSRNAALASQELRARHHATILEVLWIHGRAMAAEEIADQVSGLDATAVCRRLRELVTAGEIEATSERHRNRSGRMAVRYRRAER